MFEETQTGYSWLTVLLVFLSLVLSSLAFLSIFLTRKRIRGLEENLAQKVDHLEANLAQTVEQLISELERVTEIAESSAEASAESERAARGLARTCMNSLDLLSKELREKSEELDAGKVLPHPENNE